MTHQRALEGNKLGFERVECPGHLRMVRTGLDVIVRPRGEAVERIVVIYRCGACGCHVSIAHEWDPIAQLGNPAGELLNAYVPAPARMIEHLARRLDAKPLLTRNGAEG